MDGQVPMRPGRVLRGRWRHGSLGLILLAVVLALVWHRWPEVAGGFSGAATVPAGTWLWAAAGLLASYAIRARRIQVEWRRRYAVSWFECAFVVLQHNAAVHLLPMRAGELGFPLLLSRRWGVRPSDALASLLVLRAQDALVMALIASLSMLWVLGRHAGIAEEALAVCLALLLAACAVVGRRLGTRTHGTDAGPGALSCAATRQDAGSACEPVVADDARPAWRRFIGRVVSAWRQAAPVTWVLSALNWLVKLASLGLLFSAAAGLSVSAAWLGAIGGDIGAAIPVQAPAGFGTYEAGAALLASWAGAASPLPGLLGAALVVHLFVIGNALLTAAAAWVPSLLGTHSIGEVR